MSYAAMIAICFMIVIVGVFMYVVGYYHGRWHGRELGEKQEKLRTQSQALFAGLKVRRIVLVPKDEVWIAHDRSPATMARDVVSWDPGPLPDVEWRDLHGSRGFL